MIRKFEIELNVPDDFDETYNPPYQFGGRCAIRDGMLAWSVYAEAKVPTPQWRVARTSDEGKLARFRDTSACEWQQGKLLHWGRCDGADLDFLGLVAAKDGTLFPEWFRECEVPNEA
jgi:hypothetical protein